MKDIILLLVGIATFLTGMTMMSNGLRKASGKRVKKLFSKIKNNRLAGLGIGAATTAVIQSSAATSVMTIGFLNAGVISLFQGISVVMGAYIGTTVTGLIVSLSSFSTTNNFDISLIFMLLTVVGVILSFFKNNLVKHFGEIFSGLGLLFFGLFTLKGAFGDLRNYIEPIFEIVSNPFLLLTIGALFTMLVQSSSASTGIVIVMCASGAVSVSSAIYVALGATIGTVITTLIATIGSNANSKRLGIIALIMRTIAALIFLAILWPLDVNFGFITTLSNLFGKDGYGLFIALFMVVYNLITMFLFLPFIEKFEKLGLKLIKDKEQETLKEYVKFIDDKMLKNPSVALMQVKKEIGNMLQLSFENYKRGFASILNTDLSMANEIEKVEDGIDYLNKQITDFLIALSGKVDSSDSRIIGGYFHSINDIERIGDHAKNFLDNTRKMNELEIKFSDVAIVELSEFNNTIVQMFNKTLENFWNSNEKSLQEIHDLEEKTDDLKDAISTAHYQRITNNKCKVELSPFLCTLVSELERVADHLTNIAYTNINPTGDDK